jgi:hypothetical protein
MHCDPTFLWVAPTWNGSSRQLAWQPDVVHVLAAAIGVFCV